MLLLFNTNKTGYQLAGSYLSFTQQDTDYSVFGVFLGSYKLQIFLSESLFSSFNSIAAENDKKHP